MCQMQLSVVCDMARAYSSDWILARPLTSTSEIAPFLVQYSLNIGPDNIPNAPARSLGTRQCPEWSRTITLDQTITQTLIFSDSLMAYVFERTAWFHVKDSFSSQPSFLFIPTLFFLLFCLTSDVGIHRDGSQSEMRAYFSRISVV